MIPSKRIFRYKFILYSYYQTKQKKHSLKVFVKCANKYISKFIVHVLRSNPNKISQKKAKKAKYGNLLIIQTSSIWTPNAS